MYVRVLVRCGGGALRRPQQLLERYGLQKGGSATVRPSSQLREWLRLPRNFHNIGCGIECSVSGGIGDRRPEPRGPLATVGYGV